MARTLVLFGVILTLALSGCGGGGGGSDQTADPSYTVSGTITGLTGTLILQNSGGDDLTLSADGSFTFGTTLNDGDTYSVTVLTQPAPLTCSVSTGVGTVSGNDVTNVTVVCAANAYNVGGSVSGLSGSVVLQNNSSDALTINADGVFTFDSPVADGSPYRVTVLTQPADQSCSIANGTGTVGGGDVTNVGITCATHTYTVGGTVAGLSGSVVLQNSGGDNLTVSANGPFTFNTAPETGSTYAVTVLTQPVGQTCTVSNGDGTIAGANVSNLSVTCATNTYTIGGTVAGLTGSVVLQNNGGNNLTVSADGPFTFATALDHGSAYSVTVLTQPAGQACTVQQGAGTLGDNITSVAIACRNVYSIGGTTSGLSGSVVLQNNGGDDLTFSTNGSFIFATRLDDAAAYDVTVATQPTGQRCTVTAGGGTVASGNVTNVSVSCVNVFTVGGNVTGLRPSRNLVLLNNGADNLTVDTSGNFTFTTGLAAGETYDVTVVTQPANQHCAVTQGSGTMGSADTTGVSVRCDNAMRIAAGSGHTVAIRDDGTLWTWGFNVYGELGDGTNTNRSGPMQIGSATDWVSVMVSASSSSLALRGDGTLWTWGSGTGQNVPTQIGTANDWAAIATSPLSYHSLALRADGTLWAWGGNNHGQLGDGTTTPATEPVQIGTATDWAAIATGDYHSLALRADGTLWSWGRNNYGQLGDGTTNATDPTLAPTQVGTDTDWAAIAAGENLSLALRRDGTRWGWGTNSINGSSVLGDGTTTNHLLPTRLDGDVWLEITAHQYKGLGVRSDGMLLVWGYVSSRSYVGLGESTSINQSYLASSPVVIGADNDWQSVAVSGNNTVAQKTGGGIFATGLNTYGQLGLGVGTSVQEQNRSVPTATGTAGWAEIAHGAGRKTDGTLWRWGAYGTGNTIAGPLMPTQVGTGTSWASLDRHGTYAAQTDGTLWNDIRTGTPVQGADTGWVHATFTNTTASIGLQSAGTLWAWGTNTYGQFGNGTTRIADDSSSFTLTPEPIGTATDWTAVDVGAYHVMGIRGGALWAWGQNSYGQLGNGTTTAQLSPVQIGTATDWVKVTATTYGTIALRADGTLWGWGSDLFNYGPLANAVGSSPVQIGTASNWVDVSSRYFHTLAVRSDGTLWAWGSNDSGQLGNGDLSISKSSTPTQVGTDTDWVRVTATFSTSYALKTDGSLWSWGYNYNGELGLGFSGKGQNRSVFTAVAFP